MTDRNYITVAELNFYLNRILDAEELLHDIYVMGEISGVSLHKGNLYCTLKDEDAQIAVCCFNAEKTYMPEAGEQVLLYGTPDYYTKTGKLSFVAKRIEPFGKGKLHMELEALKMRLAEEGLFSDAHKTPAPRFSLNVCVVTSINGAVIKDIYSTVRKYNNLINIAVVNVQVQGKSAVKEISNGLRLADKGGFDTVILARGGGSFEDLMPFNSEEVARTLYNMDTYVISAVGHETDYTIADFVADARALTPTAAAEMIAFDTEQLINDVISELTIAGRKLENRFALLSARVTDLTGRVTIGVTKELSKSSERVTNALTKSKFCAERAVAAYEHRLDAVLSKLSALNPVRILKSGYFKAERDSESISSVHELNVGDVIKLYGDGGYAEAKIIKTEITNS